MDKVFFPYFVVYRYKGNPNDRSLHMSTFDTLCSLYAFIGDNLESWDEYIVGRTLECFGTITY